jgi:hypothetical protein
VSDYVTWKEMKNDKRYVTIVTDPQSWRTVLARAEHSLVLATDNYFYYYFAFDG